MSMIPILVIAALAMGLVLVVIGWRGRRVDEHPVCRKCRFDLEGVYPSRTTCPECGRDIEPKGRVRFGNRRKRRGVVALGGGLVVAALVLAGLMVTVAVGGSSLNPYKPLWMLRLEALGSNGTRAGDAIDEVLTRYDDGDLSAGEIERLVTLALDQHTDDQNPNGAAWIDAIEMLRLGGQLSEDQHARYLSQSLVIHASVRERVRIGDPIPISVVATDARIGAGRSFVLQIELGSATVGGLPAEVASSGTFLIQGRRPGGSGKSSTLGKLTLPTPLSAGVHRADATLNLRIRWQEGVPFPYDAPVVSSVELPVRLDVEVVEEDTLQVIAPTSQQRLAMGGAISAILSRSRAGDAGTLHLEITRANPPFGGVFRVFVRLDDTRNLIGDQMLRFPKGQGSVTHGFNVEGIPQSAFDHETLDLILRPDPDAARTTVDIFEIYGEEIILEDVPINRIPRLGSGA